MAKPAAKIREFYARHAAVGEWPVYAPNGHIVSYTEHEPTATAYLCRLLYGVNPPLAPVERPGPFSHGVKEGETLEIEATIGFITEEYKNV